MSDVAIRIEGLGKEYRLGWTVDLSRTFRETLMTLPRVFARQAAKAARRTARALPLGAKSADRRAADAARNESFWALRDINLEIRQGEAVGIIGRNGAGKSTLLKILSRITSPSTGCAEIHGRVGSLLEVGTGMHTELSGRENIYLNGAILGMRKWEIERRFDEIVEFAGVAQFLDTPIKRYSSGMRVRLGFAVAAHLEPEILIVDEVLAVGDAEFQKKCLGKMNEVANSGRTVLFVSHNMAAVQAMCTRGVVLEKGEIVSVNGVEKAIEDYVKLGQTSASISLRDRKDRKGNGFLRIVSFFTASDNTGGPLTTGKPAFFRFQYEAKGEVRHLHVSFAVYGNMNEPVALFNSDTQGAHFTNAPSTGTIECRLAKLPLVAGNYYITVYVTVADAISDWISQAAQFSVEQGDYFGTGKIQSPGYGHIMVDHDWAIRGSNN